MIITHEICKQLKDAEIVEKSLVEIDYFSCLYERYEKKLLRYVNRISAVSREEAEDILQDAFIKIWRNLNNYDPAMKLSSWIYRIVHNETLSFWRKKKSYGKDKRTAWTEDLLAVEAVNLEIDEDPDRTYTLTHDILDLLPIKYKSVLVLKFMESMSYEEISDVLKIPEGTVATRINRAKKAFAKKAAGMKSFSMYE